MFTKLAILLSLPFIGLLSSVSAADSDTSSSSSTERYTEKAAALVGGATAFALLYSSNAWEKNSEGLRFVLSIVAALVLSYYCSTALKKRIDLLGQTRITRHLIHYGVGLTIPFFVLYLVLLVLGASMNALPNTTSTSVTELPRRALLPAFGLSLLLNLVGFLIAYTWETDKLTDFSYALTFALTTLGLYGYYSVWPNKNVALTHDLLVTILILTWAFRLGSFLVMRIQKMGRDQRFDTMRSNFWKFGGFWLLQGVSAPIILLPTVFFLTSNADKTIGVGSLIGLVIALVGLVIEMKADLQKLRFRQNEENKGTWIDTGLWRYSRHPNYFGEMLFWVGVYVSVFMPLSSTEKILGALGPLVIIGLLLFISGIPLLEQKADKRWGDNLDYQTYKQQTSVLIPWIRDESLPVNA